MGPACKFTDPLWKFSKKIFAKDNLPKSVQVKQYAEVIIANTRKKLSGISNVGLLQQSEKVGMVQQLDKTVICYHNMQKNTKLQYANDIFYHIMQNNT